MDTERCVYVSQPACWAPGLVTNDDWVLWAEGKKQVSLTGDAPKLEFTTPLFRRRLSQISRMTVQVVHDIIEKTKSDAKPLSECKQIFTSLRGEISKEFEINRQIIQDNEILPAAFSLSVFNTPMALATIALGLKAGYSVVYPSKGNFNYALTAAAAPLLCKDEEKIIFVYADELIPPQYNAVAEATEPFAFALAMSANIDEECNIKLNPQSKELCTPKDALSYILTRSKIT